MDADFQNGFGYGMAIGIGAVAVWVIAAPHRYVEKLDRATFKHMRWLTAMRAAWARLIGRPAAAAGPDADAVMAARIESAVARRSDPRLDAFARRTGIVMSACSVLSVALPWAVAIFVAIAMLALAALVVRLEARQPANVSRRAAALRPRPPLDGALTMAIGAAAVLLAGTIVIALADHGPIAARVSLGATGIVGIAILALALRLARRPAALAADDVAIEAYVDEQFRVTRVAYLLVLSLVPPLLPIVQRIHPGADGDILRLTYTAGFAVVLAAWFAAGLRAPKTLSSS